MTVADVTGLVGAHEQMVRHGITTRALKASTFCTCIGERSTRSDIEVFLLRRTRTGDIAVQLRRGASVAPDS